jgi:uncharacterized protein YjbI with pentapeptide repeats
MSRVRRGIQVRRADSAAARRDESSDGATFSRRVDFSKVGFGSARFRGATFKDAVSFAGAVFHDEAHFEGATFEGTVSFRGARFECPAVFEQPADEANVEGVPEEVTFKRWADFRDATFKRDAGFGGARFERRARFVNTRFEADAIFDGAILSRARTLGPLIVLGKLSLDRVSFEAPITLEISANELSCVRTQFLARTSLYLRWADFTLADAEFAQPSVVEGSLRTFRLHDAELYEIVNERTGRRSPKPRLTSLRRANVGNLTLANLDLTACEFVGAHNLDRLRFEGGTDLVPSRRWRTKRRTICEEHTLPEKGASRQEAAVRTARAYRALRKGREDNKDEPGAADFYYGEMEMRRKARRRLRQDRGSPGTSSWEFGILTVYWLVSGYGLRASRALAALVITVVAATLAFRQWGFESEQEFWTSVVFSLESTSSLFRGPTAIKSSALNEWGRVFQMGLRLLGPLFLGLAILALRGRVKR